MGGQCSCDDEQSLNKNTLVGDDLTPLNKDSDKMRLGYWNFRGRAQVLRYLLEYCEIKYQDILYQTRETWFEKDKKLLETPLPNLPYLIDNGFCITEVDAIQEYILRQRVSTTKLIGGIDIQLKAKIKMYVYYLKDVQGQIFKMVFDKDFEIKKSQFWLDTLYDICLHLSTFLGRKNYFLGDLTLVDFYAYEILSILNHLYPDQFQQFQNFKEFFTRFQNIPEMAAYFASGVSQKLSFFPGGPEKK